MTELHQDELDLMAAVELGVSIEDVREMQNAGFDIKEMRAVAADPEKFMDRDDYGRTRSPRNRALYRFCDLFLRPDPFPELR
jgi:hypothetical protein